MVLLAVTASMRSVNFSKLSFFLLSIFCFRTSGFVDFSSALIFTRTITSASIGFRLSNLISRLFLRASLCMMRSTGLTKKSQVFYMALLVMSFGKSRFLRLSEASYIKISSLDIAPAA